MLDNRRFLWLAYLLAALLVAAYGWLLFWNDATFGMGDSVSHYLLARHAWGSPEQILDHWAKPVFQLLMVIPAQFGIYGVVAANGLFMLLALLAMADIARRQGIPGYPLLLAFGLLAPLVLRVTLSSLTEPVFAALLAASIWAYFTRRFVLSAALFSFLPFVRTEGMVYKWCGYLPWQWCGSGAPCRGCCWGLCCLP